MKRILTTGLLVSTILAMAAPASAQRANAHERGAWSGAQRQHQAADPGQAQRRPSPPARAQQSAPRPAPQQRAPSAVQTRPVPASGAAGQWARQPDRQARPAAPNPAVNGNRAERPRNDANRARPTPAAPQAQPRSNTAQQRDARRGDNDRNAAPNRNWRNNDRNVDRNPRTDNRNWRGNDRQTIDRNRDWRNNDRNVDRNQRADNRNWRGNDRQTIDRNRDWRNNDRNVDRNRRADNRNWRGNDRNPAYNNQRRLQARERWADQRRWSNSWRSDRRYDWQDYRARNRALYRMPTYYTPYGWNRGYTRFSIGIFLNNMLFDQNYWISDPYYYRLPPVYGWLRWVRYYDDALLVDVRDGYVVDVIHDFFW